MDDREHLHRFGPSSRRGRGQLRLVDQSRGRAAPVTRGGGGRGRPAWETAAYFHALHQDYRRRRAHWRFLRALRWLARRGWTHRRRLAPLYAALLLQLAGAILAGTERGARTAVVLTVLGAAWVSWRLHGGAGPAGPIGKLLRRVCPAPARGNRSRHWAVYTWSTAAAAALWLITAAAIGAGPPMPGFLLVGTLAAAAPWWWHHRIRSDQPSALDSRVQTWVDYVANDRGPLAGAQLSGVEELRPAAFAGSRQTEVGWTATVVLPKGKLTTSRAVDKVEDVAAAYELPLTSVVIEPTSGGEANLARLAVYTRNPLRETQHWPGPQLFDPQTGIAPIGLYADGEQTLYRFYRRGSGPVHDLIAGTTDAGKSRTLDLLLSIERHSPLMVSFVIDPQEGQSLPRWKPRKDGTRRVHGFARNAVDGLALLAALEAEMYARNRFMADFEWIDEHGRDEEGLDHFDPMFWATQKVRLPLLCLTIEEAHAVLGLPGARERVEAIAKMARKCGIKLRLVVQVPLLDQLGNSMTLRSMVAAGNVVVLRTADMLSGQVAFSGALPVDPAKLPREWPDHTSTAGLGYVLGPGARPAPSRNFYVDDPTHWATTGELTPFTPLSPQLRDWLDEHQGITPASNAAAAPAPRRPAEKSSSGSRTKKRDRGRDASPAARAAAARGSTRDAILGYLGDRGHAHTGVIANALNLPLKTVSKAISRLAAEGHLHSIRYGIWALTDAAGDLDAEASA